MHCTPLAALALSRKILVLLSHHVIGVVRCGHCACAAGCKWRFRKARGHRHGRHTGNWHACRTTVCIFEHMARIPANCFGHVASVAAQSTGPMASAYAGGAHCELRIGLGRDARTSQLEECGARSPPHARRRETPRRGHRSCSRPAKVPRDVPRLLSQKH